MPPTTRRAWPRAARSISWSVAGIWCLGRRHRQTARSSPILVCPLPAAAFLIYDAAGHDAAQLSRPGHTAAMLAEACRDALQVKGTADTAQTVLGYDAYFGTYTVDAKAGAVTHYLESALFPGDIGGDIRRRFSASAGTVTIGFDTSLRDGTPVTRTLVWSRMK
jgi:Lipocalin-like domain